MVETPSPRVESSRAFRAELRRALPVWEREGIVTPEGARILVNRYRLDETSAGIAALAVYALGAMLIGGGVISLVAWNWNALPREAKLLLILSLMLGTECAGYYLAEIQQRAVRLGHGLMLLGALVFGANIGLVAQIFHVSGHWYTGVASWSVGALAVAWVVESAPIGTLSIVTGVVAAIGNSIDAGRSALSPLFPPMVMLFAFVLFSAKKRSVWLFSIGVIGSAAAWVVALFAGAHGPMPGLLAILSASALAIALPKGLEPGRGVPYYGRASSIIGMAAFAGVAYFCSFHFLRPPELDWTRDGALLLVGVLPVAVAALLLFSRALGSASGERPSALDLIVGTGAPALGAALLATAVERYPLVMITANVALGAFAIAAIARSVESLERRCFWTGVLLAALIVVSRFFEFETGLLLKGLVFVACGVAVIAVGAIFERRVRIGGAPHAA